VLFRLMDCRNSRRRIHLLCWLCKEHSKRSRSRSIAFSFHGNELQASWITHPTLNMCVQLFAVEFKLMIVIWGNPWV